MGSCASKSSVTTCIVREPNEISPVRMKDSEKSKMEKTNDVTVKGVGKEDKNNVAKLNDVNTKKSKERKRSTDSNKSLKSLDSEYALFFTK